MKTKCKRAAARMRPTDKPEEVRYGYLIEIEHTPYLVTPFKHKRQRDRFERAILADYPGSTEIELAAAAALAYVGDQPADRRAGTTLLENVLDDYCSQHGDPLEYEDVLHEDLIHEILKSSIK